MPPRKPVPTLVRCSVRSLVNAFRTLCNSFLNDKVSFEDFTYSFDHVKFHLRNILKNSDSELATLWLHAANELAKEHNRNSDLDGFFFACCSHTPSIKIVVYNLVCIALHFNLENLPFKWYNLKEYLSNQLCKINTLKYLDYCQNTNSEKILTNQKLLESLPFLTNLISFSHRIFCTDEVIISLSKNCKLIQMLDVTSSKHVTDNSIEYLAQFKILQNLYITHTKITAEGLIKLSEITQSENLTQIDGIEIVLNRLVKEKVQGPIFNLWRLNCDLITDLNALPLIPRHFPLLRAIDFGELSCCNLPDLSFLNSLEHLEETTLCVVSDHRHYFENLPSIWGSTLTCLIFKSDQLIEISLSSFLNLGSQLPNLERIHLKDYSFNNNFGSVNFPIIPKSFRKLKIFKIKQNLHCDLAASVSGLQMILSQAFDIEKISLMANESLTDEFLSSICQTNPLSKLRKVCLSTGLENTSASPRSFISLPMLKYFINKCPKISSVKFGCDSWPNESWKELKEFLNQNNYDLKVFKLKRFYGREDL